MKTKNLLLTGALMATTIFGAVAHDKGTKDNHETAQVAVVMPRIEVPVNDASFETSLHNGLADLQTELGRQQQEENLKLLSLIRDDMRMTETNSATDALDKSLTASLQLLETQQQGNEALTSRKKQDGLMTEEHAS
ncbi:hypothetical protein [Parapedobacter tibetensis]|uniref:hypothetical protein n=1 Tax=Parapedobacter tibetensis TaxID=2972951 RepID=UPI00214DDB88|nr:hypothetical protein [Parapedobacter tibetensis]